MDNLQTKKLRPEWVDKLAESLKDEFTIEYDNPPFEYVPLQDLADFIWQEYQKLMDEYIK